MSDMAGWVATYDEKDRCIKLAEYLINNNSTVRATAKYFGISKSTVHKDIAEKLPHIQYELYQKAKCVLEKNKAERHIRGGQATKDKYLIQLKDKRNL